MLVDGRLSFDALQRRMVTSPAKARQLVAAVPASFAFDLLAVAGVDLRSGGLSAADAWRSSPPVGRPRCS